MTNTLKALIVDDEAKARNILAQLLQEYCPQVTVVESCVDVPTAVKAIYKHSPDVVFLDVEMPGYDGFQLLDFFEEVNFQVIFTTAYQEHALRAFQVSAVDYLLKPIQIELLCKAVEKLHTSPRQSAEQLQLLREAATPQQPLERIALPVAEGLLFVDVQDIIYLMAEGAYTKIILQDRAPLLISRNVKSFEEMLPTTVFFRAHRSYLINLRRIKQYVRQDGGYIVMDNGDSVSLSREKKEEFLQRYANQR
ncbi:LytR/AlgR family response regulator transcription factor [Eisenibacter elegans]|jgi:two-component system LytT family response regulator|uniref:LytR/AlgR family response regulator transcription factor n=1 Tax=Eisenibacter elegans TaxID=997 RepID=UPI00040E4E77|nr:LytTR family DNA-binding domain-containing protein [Eisenibacter elegans]